MISDIDGCDRLVLKLNAGEPALTMFNHLGQRQIYLGINELWNDTAYLSISSRIENGDVYKQAALAVTTGHLDAPGSSQVPLYGAAAGQTNVALRILSDS